MSASSPEDGFVPDPPTAGAVVGGLLVGVVVSVLVTFLLSTLLPTPAWGVWAVVAAPPLLGLLLLVVPGWRRAGSGFVMGLGIGGIVFAGVCGGFLTWINASLGG